jgi:hypothetical protein
MTVGTEGGESGSARSLRYCWLLVLLLIPFLAGGVVVGDEALLLKLAQGMAVSPLSFVDYARNPDSWYIAHHILWFLLIYASVQAAALTHIGPLLTEAIISCQTVVAGLASLALCYTFLLKRRGLSPAQSAWTVMGFFAGGYGVYAFCMAGFTESYMALAIAARLFFAEPQRDRFPDWKVAIIDVILIGLKSYSMIFIVLTWPLLRLSRRTWLGYFLPLGAFLLVLGAVKLLLWNPAAIYYNGLQYLTASIVLQRFAQQFFSSWTGLLFCLPMLLVLIWHEKSQRRAIFFKVLGLCGCAGVFSLYDFFNGDIAGGRYIFPFTIALIPQIGTAACRLLDRWPRAAWLVPVAVFAFLPVAVLGYPYFPGGVMRDLGPCRPDHPVAYSWKIVAAKMADQQRVEICFREQRYALSARDVASPHVAMWRVAYMLGGGHSPTYRAVAHDQTQKQHDAWGARLVDRLGSVGLGNPLLWTVIGLIPAILALWLSLWAAKSVDRRAVNPPFRE